MKWDRLVAQVKKEMLSVLRDPRSRMVLIGPPLIQLFIFAFAATLEVENVSLIVLDRDGGRWSHEVVERLRATRMVENVVVADSNAALAEAVDRRLALVGVAFQSDFSRRIEAGDASTLQVLLDGRRGNSAQIALGYVNEIIADVNADIAARRNGGERPAVGTVTRHWFNPNLDYLWFTVPSLVGILSMFSALIVTSLTIARERELGTFDQLLVSPASPVEIIAGKCIPALIFGTVLASVMIGAGIFVYRIPFTGSLGLLYAALVLFILSIVGVGLMISSISRTQQQAILGAFAVGVPLVLISGFATPVENMPPALQAVAQADPLKHFLVIVQGLFLKALPPEAIGRNVWPIAVIAVITLTAALVFVRGRLE
jgi:ABC-2 type transport system permease protein